MAVRKKAEKVEVEVKVEEPVIEEVVEEAPTVEIPEENGVTIDTESLKVDEEKIPEEKESKKTRIRMRVDHSCTIAMVNYVLKKDKVYDVPHDVRRILSEAGLLSPL